MRKTFRTMKALAVGVLCAAALSGCSKDDFISSTSDTYSVVTQGAEKFYNKENGQLWTIKDNNAGKVTYYVNPDIYMVNGTDESKLSSAAASFVMVIKEQMNTYGYVNVENEDDADLVVNAVNFRLMYSGVIWGVNPFIGPYFNFWGGYYPWLPVYYISIATNKLVVEIVEAKSLRTYRDWYNNIWKPANPDKYPAQGSVPEDKRPLTVWKGDISGELSNENNSTNDAYVLNLLPRAFKQSPYMDLH